MAEETSWLALIILGLTAPCDVWSGIKVSYVNDAEIRILRLHGHLQMLQISECKHTNCAASSDYFQCFLWVENNYSANQLWIWQKTNWQVFFNKKKRKHEHIRLLTHKLHIFPSEFNNKRKKHNHSSCQPTEDNCQADHAVTLTKNSASVDSSSRNQWWCTGGQIRLPRLL